jgi:16S rRNA (cytosine967-C5)-methyltransferase
MNETGFRIETGRQNARAQAAALLVQWLLRRPRAVQLLEDVEEQRSFVMELVYGVIRWQRALQRLRARFAKHRPAPPVEAALLVGLYQMLFMDDVQEFAAVHETVEAAKSLAGASSARFVNAVLRRVQAEGRQAIHDWLSRLAPPIRWSHPNLLWDRWVARFGAEGAARLCEWNNGRADVTLRVNRARIGFDEYRKALAAGNIASVPHPADAGRFLTLPRGFAVSQLPGYSEGWFYIQDPSTALAADLLAAQPGERVLDACAAPGGKTALLAEALGGNGTLVALDAERVRAARLSRNLRRLGWDAVKVAQGDIARPESARQALESLGEADMFDAVLLDVPCTNTGVFRRRPDAKWRFTLRRLEGARFRQRAILCGAATLIKPGGRVVYSTCSLEPEENEEQVQEFLKAHPEFECLDMRRLFPPDSRTDGAFAALLRRRA